MRDSMRRGRVVVGVGIALVVAMTAYGCGSRTGSETAGGTAASSAPPIEQLAPMGSDSFVVWTPGSSAVVMGVDGSTETAGLDKVQTLSSSPVNAVCWAIIAAPTPTARPEWALAVWRQGEASASVVATLGPDAAGAELRCSRDGERCFLVILGDSVTDPARSGMVALYGESGLEWSARPERGAIMRTSVSDDLGLTVVQVLEDEAQNHRLMVFGSDGTLLGDKRIPGVEVSEVAPQGSLIAMGVREGSESSLTAVGIDGFAPLWVAQVPPSGNIVFSASGSRLLALAASAEMSSAADERAPRITAIVTVLDALTGEGVAEYTSEWQAPPTVRISDDGSTVLLVGIPEDGAAPIAQRLDVAGGEATSLGSADDAVFEPGTTNVVVLSGGVLAVHRP